ncbi:MAG: hypothetical protein JXR70_05855 [Spirochaetales bacterium]|nr:hypothetical protein [Spirochaetales bacterium]
MNCLLFMPSMYKKDMGKRDKGSPVILSEAKNLIWHGPIVFTNKSFKAGAILSGSMDIVNANEHSRQIVNANEHSRHRAVNAEHL